MKKNIRAFEITPQTNVFRNTIFSLLVFCGLSTGYASSDDGVLAPPSIESLSTQNSLDSVHSELKTQPLLPIENGSASPIVAAPDLAFDLPVTYNNKVKFWLLHFQTSGKKDFSRWLGRSHKYLPKIIPVLEKEGLPLDLAYVAMIESGFSPQAVSHASAVGYWQFIAPTASRYGLQIDWWIDERRDIVKSTVAAAKYLADLYKMFGSWYLAAASYNTGENRIKSLIKKHQTRDYWILSQKRDFPKETEQYIPKLLAALLISKAPRLYGFNDVKPQPALQYDSFDIPGGVDLENFAYFIGLEKDVLVKLNPELIKGFLPQFVRSHRIKIPRGTLAKAKEYTKVL
jgi:membrane-bound lytic murein transglycosylase D